MMRAAVVVASNRAAAGVYDDTTGPLLVDLLVSLGFSCNPPIVVPDGQPVGAAISAEVDGGARVVLTTGGTGLTPTDRTPEVTRALLDRQVPGIAGQVGAGTGIGFLSGMVGAGGGFVSVPFMTWCNVPMHNAVATSAALGFPIALANVIGYLIGGRSLPAALPGAFGYLYLPALAVIAVASVLLAPAGAKAAHALNVAQLKRTFAGLLYGLASYMLYKGLVT